jgi:hypothetical protein
MWLAAMWIYSDCGCGCCRGRPWLAVAGMAIAVAWPCPAGPAVAMCSDVWRCVAVCLWLWLWLHGCGCTVTVAVAVAVAGRGWPWLAWPLPWPGRARLARPWRCVAMCGNVWQCVAVAVAVAGRGWPWLAWPLPWLAVAGWPWQAVAGRGLTVPGRARPWQCVAMCSDVWQCVVICSDVWRCVAVCLWLWLWL